MINPLLNDDSLLGVLQDANILPDGRIDKNLSSPNALRQALNKRKGTIEEVAANMVELMETAENENVRLSAAKMIAAAHGALNELTDAAPPVINITIESNHGQQAINILMPHVVGQPVTV